MRSFLPSRRFLKDKRLPEGKGSPFGAPSALSVYIVLLKKGMSQWFGLGPLCGPGSEGSEGSACLWQAGSEGCGGGFAADYKKGRGSAAGCVEGLWKKVLKMDRPLAGGFLSLTALRAEGCGLPLCGNAYKVSVTGFTFGIIWQNKHYDDQPPPVAFPSFGALRHHLPAPLGSVSHDSQVALLPYESCSLATAERWDNKALKSSPFISSSQHNGAL